MLAAAFILPLSKRRISHSFFHWKIKAQADWKDWLSVMLVEDLILYLCRHYLCSCSLVIIIAHWFALSTDVEVQA